MEQEIKSTRQAMEAIAAEVRDKGWKIVPCEPHLRERLRARFYHERRSRRIVGNGDWDDIRVLLVEGGVIFELNKFSQAVIGGLHEGPQAA